MPAARARPGMPPVEDFWTTALGKTGPVDVPLPPDNEPKAFAQRRRRREKALKLITKYSGLYAAEAAPEWVVKCIMNIDRSYWRQLEHTLTDVETLKKHLEGLKKEAEEPLRKALRQVDELSRLVKENEEMKRATEVAQATAAAATAELLQMRSGITRLQTSRALRTQRLREGYAKARRDLRVHRLEGKDTAVELARAKQANAKLEKDVGALRAQLDTMALFNEQQRALMTAKVTETVQELKAPGKKCKWCGPRVCAKPVINKVPIN